jgi:hypothetical protein
MSLIRSLAIIRRASHQLTFRQLIERTVHNQSAHNPLRTVASPSFIEEGVTPRIDCREKREKICAFSVRARSALTVREAFEAIAN